MVGEDVRSLTSDEAAPLRAPVKAAEPISCPVIAATPAPVAAPVIPAPATFPTVGVTALDISPPATELPPANAADSAI